MPLSGGYRRTPILQVGADVYCDSHCILREIQRRHPGPTFFPDGSEGLVWAVGRWTDALFDMAVRLSVGANADQLPEAFLKDRGRLFFGPDWNVKKLKGDLPHAVAQLRAQFGWLNHQLADKRPFLLGIEPGLIDAMAYYLVWFVRARWQGGPALIADLPALEAWEQRVKGIGHGRPEDMSSAEALDVAHANETTTPERGDPREPQALQPGQRVSVVPDLDSGEPAVIGAVRLIEHDTIAILRDDPRVGTVCVHFPRVGYRVTAA